MGFIRATIDYDETNKIFTSSIYSSWVYFGEKVESNTFDTLCEAREWILTERCYNKLVITDDAKNALSYKDALAFQLKKKKKYPTSISIV
jgi:hypothetical protein